MRVQKIFLLCLLWPNAGPDSPYSQAQKSLGVLSDPSSFHIHTLARLKVSCEKHKDPELRLSHQDAPPLVPEPATAKPLAPVSTSSAAIGDTRTMAGHGVLSASLSESQPPRIGAFQPSNSACRHPHAVSHRDRSPLRPEHRRSTTVNPCVQPFPFPLYAQGESALTVRCVQSSPT
ncbi:hypothetical protein V8G54_009648 [Vigna mungo]|uniref:Uncharacterized protein n=1 Tax=Vigna mungo TaxID=3915 RepID=A0AAQ3S5P4_VIGMU